MYLLRACRVPSLRRAIHSNCSAAGAARSRAVDIILGLPPAPTYAEEVKRIAELLPHQGICE